MRIAIDTGGTFTDCVYLKDARLEVLKVISTPNDPARSVFDAVARISRDCGGKKHLEVRHGTTIGTNALLERKGARVAFVTTAGFEDTIAIGRQARHELYNWMATPTPCLVPAELRFGVKERVSAEGEILIAPIDEELNELGATIRTSGAEGIAISLLFSFANPATERRVAEAISAGNAGPALPISVSHQILPEFREYERASTVVVNAYLAPKAGGYMQRLQSALEQKHTGKLYVMQSSGGIISAEVAAQEPVRTVLSGPAGGVIGAHKIAQLAGVENIISFDMGGTSTDVSLIEASGPQLTNEARLSEIPISVPMLDIHTVGAGGGSLARFDRGGILHVGPMSAGADPGPICYGQGEQPTVTDANLVLGRLDEELALAGTVRLNKPRTLDFMEKARGPIPSVEAFASGTIRLAEVEMEKAIRVISEERGHDPRDFTLVCFGGAGPQHACSLAGALGIPRVLVPAMPGALSALGILMADVVRDYSRTVVVRVPSLTSPSKIAKEPTLRKRRESKGGSASVFADSIATLEGHFGELESRAAAEFRREGLRGMATRSADLRYAGQGYELNVPAGPDMIAAFHASHRKRYGHADDCSDVEVVSIRVRVVAAAEKIELPRKRRAGADCSAALLKQKPVMFDGEWMQTPVFDRERLKPGNRFKGPAIVHEYSGTTVVPPGCRAEVDEYSNIVAEIG